MVIEKYNCEGAECLTIATRSKSAELQARWLMMAQAWFRLANNCATKRPRSDSSNILQLPSKQMSRHARLLPVAPGARNSLTSLVVF
jgi:hypothetical protein